MTPVSAGNITRHELIGLNAMISSSSNKSQKKIKGSIVAETRNTLTLRNSKKDKIIAKGGSSLVFNLNGTLVKVEGKTLIGRPEDRVKKKSKRDW